MHLQRARERRAGPSGGAAVLGAGLGLLLGCLTLGTFPCERDDQCVLDGRAGLCLEPGYCALPDSECEDGYRFHDRGVPDHLAGRCAALPASGTTDSSSGRPPVGASSSSTSGGGSSGSGSSSSTGATTGDECSTDGPCGCAASISAGNNHTCVIRLDGVVVCWGANGLGQLGTGRETEASAWPQRADLSLDPMPIELSSGSNHVCARMEDKSELCWGRNIDGEIDPSSSNELLGPTSLPLTDPAEVIALGPMQTCVSVGPSTRCTGSNGFGQLGGPGPAPVDGEVGGAQALEQMALGRHHSCALKNSRVWCWGRNNWGQLGVPAIEGSTDSPEELDLGGAAELLAAGRDHGCVVMDQGTQVTCWGRNDEGQIGDGTTIDRGVPTPLAESFRAPVVAMKAKVSTTCVQLGNGELWCWGGTEGSALGTSVDAGEPMVVPWRVTVIDELPEPIVDFGLGATHMCVLGISSRVWCWGSEGSPQLGPEEPSPGRRAVDVDVCPPDEG